MLYAVILKNIFPFYFDHIVQENPNIRKILNYIFYIVNINQVGSYLVQQQLIIGSKYLK